MAFVYRPLRTRTDPKTGRKTKAKSSKWYARYRDPKTGKKVTVAGYTDRAATVQLAARLEREAAQRAEGLLAVGHDAAKRPLAEHLADFAAHLAAKGDVARHVATVRAHLAAVAAGCRWERLADLAATAAEQWLAERRDDQAVRFGPGTFDNYVRELQHLGRWLVEDSRLAASPFGRLRPLHVRSERKRRALTRPEFARLLDAARAGPPFGADLSGPQRAVLYAAAGYTGLRAAELASLTPESFRLDADPPTWSIAAAAEKAGRGDELPLHVDLVAALRDYLPGVQPGTPLWPGRWAADFCGSKMLKRDLKAAGIPYRTADGTFDFHALRVHFCTELARAGVPQQIAQRLMRHTTAHLTATVYSRFNRTDLAGAVGQLPRLKTSA